MNWFRRIAPVGYLVLLAVAALPVHGQEKKPAAKEIDAATVAAYEKIGAEYVRWQKLYLNSQIPGTSDEGLPEFQFHGFPTEKLPDVATPFALSILYTNVTTDAQMKELAGLKNLTALRLTARVSAAGLKELAALEKLSELALYHADTAGLKELAEFKGLKTLWLGDVTPRGKGAKELGALVNLEELALSGVYLGPSIKELASLKRLHTLSIGGSLRNKVSEYTFKVLGEIGLLHALVEAAGKDGVRPRSADEVTSFDTDGWMTPATIKTISSFKNLESLHIANAGPSERRGKKKGIEGMNGMQANDLADRLKELAPFEKLAALDLSLRSDWNLRTYTGVGLTELGNFKQFTKLNLGGWRLSPGGTRELATLKNLTGLQLANTPMTDADLKELAGLKKLTSLNLNKTEVTNTGMKEVAGFKNLAALSLAKTRVRDFGVKELSGLKDLAALDLSDTEVTDAALRELAGLKKLAMLKLVGTRTTDAGIAELQKALPNCKIER